MKNDKKCSNIEEVRIPPPRGQIKARIFKNLAKQVKVIASVTGILRKEQSNNGSYSSSSTPPPSNYNTEGHSDV